VRARRAVDQHGVEFDILLQKRRDKAAAKRFFKRVLAACPEASRKIVTDQLARRSGGKVKTPDITGTPRNAKNKKPRRLKALRGFLFTTPTVLLTTCWCPREDSNLHTLRRMDLNHVRLPIPPPGPTDTAKSAILANDSKLSMVA
jgi:hypothetical protein